MPRMLKMIKTDLKKMPSKKYSPKINPNKYPKLKVSTETLSVRPAINVKTLTFKAIVDSESTTGAYTVQITFFSVKYSKDKVEGYIPIKMGNTLWYYEKPSVNLNPVSLKCECDAYRFYWEKWNADNNANIGPYRKYDAKKIDRENGVNTRGVPYYTLAPGYVRKTPAPPEGRPFLNPGELMGYCKHLNSLLLLLKKANYIRGSHGFL